MVSSGSLAHLLLELLAYVVGAQSYYWQKRRVPIASRPDLLQSWAIVAGAVFGAACGSKLLYVLQYWHALQTQPALVWWSGKTIAGGLLGGWVGVELAKLAVRWPHSTGDLFIWPLLMGMCIGRVGCQLAGLEDLTYGGMTSLPWGWDYGDGVLRHPVALYEVAGLLIIGAVLLRCRHALARVAGDRFKAFMIGYLLLRLLLECFKPPHVPIATGMLSPSLYAGLSAIQWVCVLGLVTQITTVRRWATASNKQVQ